MGMADSPSRKARLTASSAILLSKDVPAAARHYAEKLGFDVANSYGEPPCFVILHRDGCYLMLAGVDDAKHVVPHWKVRDKTSNVYFWVDDADSLCEEFKARGATIDYGPCDQPYGCREFGIQDLDGYDIAFGTYRGES